MAMPLSSAIARVKLKIQPLLIWQLVRQQVRLRQVHCAVQTVLPSTISFLRIEQQVRAAYRGREEFIGLRG